MAKFMAVLAFAVCCLGRANVQVADPKEQELRDKTDRSFDKATPKELKGIQFNSGAGVAP